MFGISGWVISIIGVAVGGILLDVLLSDSKLSKYIKGIYSIFVVFLILNPLINLVKNNNFKDNIFSSYTPNVDYAYTDFLKNEQQKYYENYIIKQLENKGFVGVDVEISHILEENTFIVEKINLNLKNLVINQNMLHINKYTEIKSIVMQCILVEEEKIVFDG